MAYYRKEEVEAIALLMERMKGVSDMLDGHFLSLGSIAILDSNGGEIGTLHSIDDGEWEFQSA